MRFAALRGWTSEQRSVVIASFLGWTLDAFDFFLLVFVLKDIAREFNTEISEVTFAILLTLAMRPIGAFLFGRAADRWGRRPTLMVPATGETAATYESAEAVKGTIASTHQACLGWRTTTFRERAEPMRRAAEILRGNAREYGRLMAEEMGEPIRDGIAEVQKCAVGSDHYAEHTERFLAPEPVKSEARKSFVAFNPLDVVLAVMPWNFPFWQVFRFAAPGLMAGNATVLKHASNDPFVKLPSVAA
jgi:acyl-CoA reductase-like NAD-dependent aldehyde dehydrogenase